MLVRQPLGLPSPVIRRSLLAPGRDPAIAADACWALTGPRLFLDLTTDRGWQPGRYEDWLARMLTANLLTPACHAPAPSRKAPHDSGTPPGLLDRQLPLTRSSHSDRTSKTSPL